jgi:hypothetical protein
MWTYVVAVELNALGNEAVDGRGVDVGGGRARAVVADLGPAKVIDQDHEDVRARCGSRQEGQQQQARGRHAQRCFASHGCSPLLNSALGGGMSVN